MYVHRAARCHQAPIYNVEFDYQKCTLPGLTFETDVERRPVLDDKRAWKKNDSNLCNQEYLVSEDLIMERNCDLRHSDE